MWVDLSVAESCPLDATHTDSVSEVSLCPSVNFVPSSYPCAYFYNSSPVFCRHAFIVSRMNRYLFLVIDPDALVQLRAISHDSSESVLSSWLCSCVNSLNSFRTSRRTSLNNTTRSSCQNLCISLHLGASHSSAASSSSFRISYVGLVSSISVSFSFSDPIILRRVSCIIFDDDLRVAIHSVGSVIFSVYFLNSFSLCLSREDLLLLERSSTVSSSCRYTQIEKKILHCEIDVWHHCPMSFWGRL